jgi:hypothetical protein
VCNFAAYIEGGTWLRVFENRVLRRMFGPKRNEVTGLWRKLHDEELNYLYSLPNIFWVIKLRRIRCTGHVAYMGVRRGVRERDLLEDQA